MQIEGGAQPEPGQAAAESSLPRALRFTDPDPSPALRDARRISERIADDELLADDARGGYRFDGLPVLEPEPSIAPVLASGELLHAVHPMALLEVGAGAQAGEAGFPIGGSLLVTSGRLVHRGLELRAWPLDSIAEMSVALERLLLVSLRDGSDLAVEVDTPRLLRVQLAAAIAALRDAPAPARDEAAG